MTGNEMRDHGGNLDQARAAAAVAQLDQRQQAFMFARGLLQPGPQGLEAGCIEAGLDVPGTMTYNAGAALRGTVDRLVISMSSRTLLPSSHPAWSAKFQRISCTPPGFHDDALDGMKVGSRRAVMYEALFRPAK